MVLLAAINGESAVAGAARAWARPSCCSPRTPPGERPAWPPLELPAAAGLVARARGLRRGADARRPRVRRHHHSGPGGDRRSRPASSSSTWIVTRYAVLPLLTWAIRYTFRGIGDLYRLATRALPLMLLFITFLFINTEVWQVAGPLAGSRLWSVIGLFALLGVVFILGRVPSETRLIESTTSAATVVEACAGTPLADIAASVQGIETPVPLTRRQTGERRPRHDRGPAGPGHPVRRGRVGVLRPVRHPRDPVRAPEPLARPD